MALKHCVSNFATVTGDGRQVTVLKGQVWEGDDPVVKANPDRFADRPEYVHSTTKSGVIETATAAPGEKRAAKKAAAKTKD
jgi:hypothetical protein